MATKIAASLNHRFSTSNFSKLNEVDIYIRDINNIKKKFFIKISFTFFSNIKSNVTPQKIVIV